jgi:hypothetical protein
MKLFIVGAIVAATIFILAFTLGYKAGLQDAFTYYLLNQ